MTKQNGFSVVEVLLAMALFVIIASGIVGLIIRSYTSNRQGAEETIADQYASEGIEALRSLKNQSYPNLANTNSSGLTQTAGTWALNSTNNVFEKYTRSLAISD